MSAPLDNGNTLPKKRHNRSGKTRQFFVKLSLRPGRDDAVIAMLNEVETGSLAGFVRFVLAEQARREVQAVPGTGYLAGELEALLGVQIATEQERAMAIALNVVGESVASFIFALQSALRMKADGSGFASERVKAWQAGLGQATLARETREG